MLYSVFVGHLPNDTLKDELVDLFSECGEVKDVYIHPDPDRPYGYGFVRFLEVGSVLKAVQEVSEWTLRGTTLKIEIASESKEALRLSLSARRPTCDAVKRDNIVRSRVKDCAHTINKELDLIHGDVPLDSKWVMDKMESLPSRYAPKLTGSCTNGVLTNLDNFQGKVTDGLFADGDEAEEEKKRQHFKDHLEYLMSRLQAHFSSTIATEKEEAGLRKAAVQDQAGGRPPEHTEAAADGAATSPGSKPVHLPKNYWKVLESANMNKNAGETVGHASFQESKTVTESCGSNFLVSRNNSCVPGNQNGGSHRAENSQREYERPERSCAEKQKINQSDRDCSVTDHLKSHSPRQRTVLETDAQKVLHKAMLTGLKEMKQKNELSPELCEMLQNNLESAATETVAVSPQRSCVGLPGSRGLCPRGPASCDLKESDHPEKNGGDSCSGPQTKLRYLPKTEHGGEPFWKQSSQTDLRRSPARGTLSPAQSPKPVSNLTTKAFSGGTGQVHDKQSSASGTSSPALSEKSVTCVTAKAAPCSTGSVHDRQSPASGMSSPAQSQESLLSVSAKAALGNAVPARYNGPLDIKDRPGIPRTLQINTHSHTLSGSDAAPHRGRGVARHLMTFCSDLEHGSPTSHRPGPLNVTISRPGLSTAAMIRPSPSRAAVFAPSPSTAAVFRSGLSMAAVTTPNPSTAAVTTPGPFIAAVTTPSPSTAAVFRPGPSTAAVTTPNPSTAAVTTSSPSTAALTTSSPSTASVTTSSPFSAAVLRPGSSTAAASRPLRNGPEHLVNRRPEKCKEFFDKYGQKNGISAFQAAFDLKGDESPEYKSSRRQEFQTADCGNRSSEEQSSDSGVSRDLSPENWVAEQTRGQFDDTEVSMDQTAGNTSSTSSKVDVQRHLQVSSSLKISGAGRGRGDVLKVLAGTDGNQMRLTGALSAGQASPAGIRQTHFTGQNASGTSPAIGRGQALLLLLQK